MASTIFSGSYVKTLLSGLNLNGNATVWSGNTDPSSVAFSGNAGDVYISTSTNNLYVKQDAGNTTSWSKSSTLISFTSQSVPFANGSGNLTQDNSHFNYNSGTNTLTITVISGTSASFSSTVTGSNLSGTNTGDVTLASVGAVPANAGASLSGQVLTLQPADGTHPGLITSGTQTIGGAKTFSSTIAALNLSGSNTGDQTITLTSDVTGSGTGSFATTVAKIQGVTVSGTTGTTNVVFSTSPTISNPVVGTQSQADNSTKAASTAYVTTAINNAIAGVNPAVAVQAATTAASDTSSFTYNNGVSGIGATLTGVINTALTVDGFTFTALAQRLLVKNDTQSPSGAFNGVYYVTQVQTGILPLILTRALDFDTPSDINNTGSIPVINGTVNGTTSWVVTSSVSTVGTDPVTFTKFTRNPADYLLVANNLSDVNSSSTSFNNISGLTTLGDTLYGGASGTRTRLAGNTTTTKKFLTQTGDSVNSAAPGWNVIVAADLPIPNSAGDITETSFSAANNQSSVANVTGLAFANATVRSAKILLSVYVNATSSLYEAFDMLAIQKGSSWELAQTSVGDASGFVFTITNAGQLQYTDSNYTGFSAATVKFRAQITSV